MELFYPAFYQRYGIRKTEELVQPRIAVNTNWEFPRDSLLHFQSDEESLIGPDANDPFFASVTKPIQIYHALDLINPQGRPRLITEPLNKELQHYQIKNRRFRRLMDLKKLPADDKTLIVMNYSLTLRRFKYPKQILSEYLRWKDIQSTIFATANEIAKKTQRAQFIRVKMPQILPSITMLIACVGALTEKTTKLFTAHESRFVLELWKWLDEEKRETIFDAVEINNLKYINLVFQEGSRWFVLNLGLLFNWKKSNKDDSEEAKTARTAFQRNLFENTSALTKFKSSREYDPMKLQRYVLRLLMRLTETRSETSLDSNREIHDIEEGESKPDEDDQILANKDDETKDDDVEDTSTSVKTAISLTNKKKDFKLGIDGTNVDKIIADELVDNDASQFVIDDRIDKLIEDDLKELDRIQQVVISEGEVVSQTTESLPVQKTLVDFYARDDRDYQQKFTDQAKTLSMQGLLSAAELRRFEKMAGQYKNITSPFSDEKLDVFANIDTELLSINDDPTIPDSEQVFDKSMLKSTLLDFDKRYVRDVMQKDIVGAVLKIQDAGYAIEKFEAEKVDSILGSYYVYTVRVIPIEGSPSTLRFKIPAIDESGTYMSNGVKYVMRKQRGDLPIRQVAPNKVALTSYYGKFFVVRSRKQSNNYGAWLKNHILSMSLDADNTVIAHANASDVFDKTKDYPRSFSSLSMSFRDFVFTPVITRPPMASDVFTKTLQKSFHYLLGQKDRQNDPIMLAAINQFANTDFLPVAVANDGTLLLVDKNDDYHVHYRNQTTPVGKIETLLGIDLKRSAPIEYAEIRLGGNYLPIGMILAYDMGLTVLLDSLKVDYVRVPHNEGGHSRKGIPPDYLKLQFRDETIGVSTKNKVVELLLGGFVQYSDQIRQYSVHEFDRKGVYLNIIESGGGNARTVREIDLLYKLFVDPITRDILIERNEPTEFRGILKFAVDLLLTDSHHDEFDMSEMRIKGYERVTGVIYQELVKSIRQHRARPGRSRLPVDLNPYAVWKTLSEDAAIKVYEDVNPIQDLKQIESVTYSGHGGRKDDTMTALSRAYQESDIGIISEATTDSGSVGINTYTSANPQFRSLRGTIRKVDTKTVENSALVSTTFLVSPGIDKDD